MSISVIIPCYNCTAVLERCVAAILAGSLVPEEIILVDDCSTDGTRALIQRLELAHPGRVRLVAQERNGGPGKARNAGAAAARGEFLFFLDSDTEIEPEALARFAARIPEADAVVGIYTEVPLNPGASPLYKAMLYAYLLGDFGVRPYDQFSASCAGIRASVFRELGGYDEWFKPGVDLENEEFGHRIFASRKMLIDPSIRAGHHFPYFRKMASTFFARTALWVEMFSVRRRFSTVAGTPSTGFAAMAMLGAVCTLPVALVLPAPFLLVPAALLALHLYGFRGFFAYVKARRPDMLAAMTVLNMLYSTIIAAGAAFGLARVITGRSEIVRHFAAKAG